MDLTGVVSDIYMCHWDQQLIAKLQEISMDVILYKRYKDDVNLVSDGGRDVEKAAVMSEVKEIADTVDPSLTVTTDCAENHADGRTPVLDLKVWIGEDGHGNNKVLFSHYMKEVASKATIHWRSSHGNDMKRNVMINELTRIFRNCSSLIPWNETSNHITHFMKRMQFSGYPVVVRREVVAEAVKKFEKCAEQGARTQDGCGLLQQNQPRTDKWQQWYQRNGGYESVMFVEATPESELKKRIQMVVKRLHLKIKVVERAGCTIKSMLQRSNPFGVKDCLRDRCLICSQGCGTDCRTRGCVYEFLCVDCSRRYRGQTGRSIYERGVEHLKAWEREEDGCPLQRHANLYHGGGHFEVQVKVLSKCYGRPTKRLITEAVLIDELPDNEAMNSKSEWTYVKLGKVQVQRS